MKVSLALVAFVTAVAGQGAGPYPAGWTTDSRLSRSTIYRPNSPPSGQLLPVLLWGNGACSANGLSNTALLTQIASYGYWVFSSGCPNCSGSTTSQQMKDNLNFVTNYGGTGNYSTVDKSRVAVAGFSCGGTEAYELIPDSRVQTINIVSSGLLSNYDFARTITKTIFFTLGGSSDIAYQNGERDYSYLPSSTPAWKGNLPVGHGGTLGDTNGGRFGVAILAWLQYYYRGDAASYRWLTAGGATSAGWSVQMKNLRAPGTTTVSPPPSTTAPPTSPTTTAPPTTTTNPGTCSPLYGQCGGIGWTGASCCATGTCRYNNDWYSQCLQ